MTTDETRLATITLADGTTGTIYAVREGGQYQLVCEHEDGSREDCHIPLQATLDDCRAAAQQSWGIGDWALEFADD